MPQDHTIRSQWENDDTQRQSILKEARRCAALTKPWILPPEGQSKSERLPETYQSIGSRGVTNLEGRMLLALYPPEAPWFLLDLDGSIKHDPDVPNELKQAIAQRLFVWELLVQSVLESAHLQETDRRRRRRSSFRSRKRMALSQILVTGDVLEQLTDDYRIKVFRRDQYVTKRDSAGDVLYHIVRERIDPLTLPEDQVVAAGLDQSKLRDKMAHDRMTDIYTDVEWNPLSRVWVIRQEVNGKIVVTSEEPISPYFSTPYELAPNEDYGRGFIELNIGDLRSQNELEERLLDFAAMASKFTPAIDYASQVREKDLAKPTGVPIRARVTGGRVQDVAMLSVEKINDFRVVYETAERKGRELSKAMLLESDIQPQQERVTATQVQRIAMELEGMLGGVYAPIADEQQVPLIQRTIYQLQRDNLMPAFADEDIEIKALTGLAALGQAQNAQRVMTFVQVMAQLGPEAMQRVDLGVLTQALARYSRIDEPGLVKDDEQLAAEQQAAQQQMIEQQAAAKAIDTAGNVAEEALTQET